MNHASSTENRELMARARNSLKGNWGTAVGAFIVYMFISIILMVFMEVDTSGFFAIGSLIINGPLILGLSMFSLSLSRQGEAKVSQIFDGFNRFGAALGAFFLLTIIVLLGYILLIVPGIIATYAVAMTFFIIADDPGIGAWEAIKKSNELMRGNKWKLFCLLLRFIGWFILSFLTLGLGFLWASPYMMVSTAKFYDDILGRLEKTDQPDTEMFSDETVAEDPASEISAGPGTITLTVDSGPNAGSFYPVSREQSIGRADDNDIVLKLKTVSGYHCRIAIQDGKYVLQDLDSTNGTRVNGEVIKESVIEPGMTIEISTVKLTVT